MKINIIVPFIYRVGGIKLIFEYANRLSNLGHDIVVYYPIYPYNNKRGEFDIVYNLKRFYRFFKQWGSENEHIDKFKSINFEIKRVPLILNRYIRNADISIATAWTTAYSVKGLDQTKGEKFYFVQDYENWESNVKYVDNSYKLGLKMITTCQYLRDLLMEKFSVESTVIFIGIDNNIFYNESKVFDRAKSVLFVDSGMERKNSQMAVDTILKLKRKYPDLNIESFGHKLVHKLPSYVKFTSNPSDDEIREIYSRSDIFLGTSNVEGFALPPAEAMACKCAVVSTSVGAVPEYSRNGISAIHIKPGDSEALFKSACFLIDNPDKWKDLSINGYKDYLTYLNCWDDSVNKIEKLFLTSVKAY